MIEIPHHFFATHYADEQIPGVAHDLMSGANCQHFCYEVLRYFGYEIGPMRSSDLWEDKIYTTFTETSQPFDLILFNKTFDPYGAHVGIYVSDRKILHLSKKIDKPVIWEERQFLENNEYKVRIGIKRPMKRI